MTNTTTIRKLAAILKKAGIEKSKSYSSRISGWSSYIPEGYIFGAIAPWMWKHQRNNRFIYTKNPQTSQEMAISYRMKLGMRSPTSEEFAENKKAVKNAMASIAAALKTNGIYYEERNGVFIVNVSEK